MNPQSVYLLHYAEPHPNGRHPRHYIGQAVNVAKRTKLHAEGKSRAAFTRSMAQHSIPFEIARVWPWESGLERRLKRSKNAPRFCPMCQSERTIARPAAA